MSLIHSLGERGAEVRADTDLVTIYLPFQEEIFPTFVHRMEKSVSKTVGTLRDSLLMAQLKG